MRMLTKPLKFLFTQMIEVNTKTMAVLPVHRPKYPILELIDVPAITPAEIENFDKFYSTQTVSEFRTSRGKRYLYRKTYKPVIKNILDIKLGHNYDNIMNFLYYRDENITDIELAYCLDIIRNHHESYLLPIIEKYMPNILQLIKEKRIQFHSLTSISSLLKTHLESPFLPDDIILDLIETVFRYSEHIETEMEKGTEKLSFGEDLSLILIILQYFCKIPHQTNRAIEGLLKLRRMISRHLDVLKISDLIKFLELSTKYESLLLTEVASVLLCEYALISNYQQLNFQQKILCGQSLAHYPSKKSILVETFLFEIEAHPELLTSMNRCSELIWMFSQFEFEKISRGQMWKLMESWFLYLCAQDSGFDIQDISRIIQVFGQNSQGSISFWNEIDAILTTNENCGIMIVLKQLDFTNPLQFIGNYGDYFTLMQNYLRLGIQDVKLIGHITRAEVNGMEFKYISGSSAKKKLQMLMTFSWAYSLLDSRTEMHHKAFRMLITSLNLTDGDREYMYSEQIIRLQYIVALCLSKQLLMSTESTHQQHFIEEEIRIANKKFDRLVEKCQLDLISSIIIHYIMRNTAMAPKQIEKLEEWILVSVPTHQKTQSFHSIIQLAQQLGIDRMEIWVALINKVQQNLGLFEIEQLSSIKQIFAQQLRDDPVFIQFEFTLAHYLSQSHQSLHQIQINVTHPEQVTHLVGLLNIILRLDISQ